MKSNSFLLVAMSAACAVMACSVDAYDKGEGEYSMMTAEMVDATVGSDGKVAVALSDEGEHLTLTPPMTVKWMEKHDTTYRALFYYNLKADGKVEGLSMHRVGVLVPHALRPEDGKEQPAMKTDPVYVESIWVGRNNKYVNMRLRLLTGATDDEKAVQTIGMIRDTLASTNGHERITLYHDQGGRPEYYSSTAYASIPLDKVEADTLTITVNTYGGLFEKTIVKN